MSISSSWMHGNALTIESPIRYGETGQEVTRLILTPSGQGAWVSTERGGITSWMHLPIPTIYEATSRFERFELLSVSLLFECWDSSIQFVHIYDGYEKIAEFNGVMDQGLGLTGNRLVKSNSNTFILKQPHHVKRGIGLSFFFAADANASPAESLFVAAACADFRTRNILFGDLFRLSR